MILCLQLSYGGSGQASIRIPPSQSRLENLDLQGVNSAQWSAGRALKCCCSSQGIKCSPFPVPPMPNASSAPTARKGGRKTGKLGARWGTRSCSTEQGDHNNCTPGSFCCSCASFPFRTSILLLSSPCQNSHRWEEKQLLFVNGKLGTQLGKIILQQYTISKVAIIKFLSLTTLSKQISCSTFPFTQYSAKLFQLKITEHQICNSDQQLCLQF